MRVRSRSAPYASNISPSHDPESFHDSDSVATARSAHRSATPRSPRSTCPWKRPSSSINVLGAHASPWQTTSWSIGGESVTHGGRPNGQSSTGSRSCITRNPTPIARAAARGLATQWAATADRPGNPLVCSQPSPVPSTCGTRTAPAAQRSRSASATRWCAHAGGDTLTYSRPPSTSNVTPPNSLTHTGTTGRPPAIQTTISGTGTGSLGTVTGLGCLMWNRYMGQSFSSPALYGGCRG